MSETLGDAKSIFLNAAEIPPGPARVTYVEQRCGADAALRREVEGLLEHEARIGGFLESPPAAAAGLTVDQSAASPLGEAPGTAVGPYKLLEQIGEGGMGVVFLAEQQRPVRRQVAVKVIKAGMDTKQVVARFDAERQALAIMDHPNIARVLDAGATETGRPYFVMELVKGVPITGYCDERKLTLRDRLALFVQVCQAVQHAHSKGIIHRDLKPSNVLVALYDGRPVPKVIDFGVAKATGGRLTEHTVFTGFGSVVGTPEHMSPEQAELNQLDVDTRSDVYSLGVILYELLTGSTPVERGRFKQAALLEMLRVVREEEAPRPSTRLSTTNELASIAANRGLEPKKLGGVVKGELDWIVMRCLEKDRSRRYETASGLAKDVERYLADEAVQACPPTTAYRFRKFARRNRAALGAIAFAALAGLVLLSAAIYHNAVLRRAVRAADAAKLTAQEKKGLARRAVDEMYTEVAQRWLASEPHQKEAQRHFLLKALAFYEEFAREEGPDPSVALQAARASERVGNIHRMLGQRGEAERAYRSALDRLQRLAAHLPLDPELRRQLGSAWGELGVVLGGSNRHREEEQALRHSLEIGEGLEKEFPNDPAYQYDQATAHNNLANFQRSVGRLPDAKQSYLLAVQRQEKLVGDSPQNPDYRRALAENLSNLGVVLAKTDGPSEAEQCHQQAVEAFEKLAADFPGVPEYRHGLGGCLGRLGNVLLETDRPKQAEDAILRAVEVYERLVADFPTVPAYRYQLAVGHNNIGTLRAKLGRPRQAEPSLQRALELRLKLHADFPAAPEYRLALVSTYDNLGSVLSKLDRVADAERAHQHALAIVRKLASDFPAVSEYQHRLAAVCYNLAIHLVDSGRPEDAVTIIDEGVRRGGAGPAGKGDMIGDLLDLRLRQFEKAKDAAGCSATAEMYENLKRSDPESLYNAACFRAVTAAVVRTGDASEAAAKRADAEADRAMAWLSQAVAAGYNNAAHMQKDADLAALRGRDDFRKLLKELEAPTKPK